MFSETSKIKYGTEEWFIILKKKNLIMKTLIKYLAFVLLLVASYSCVDELDYTTYRGNVQLKLTTTTDLTGEVGDYSVKAKFYREYTGKYTILDLDVDSISEDGIVYTEAVEVEYGRYELQLVNLIKDGKSEFGGIGADDERAWEVDESSLLPIVEDVEADETQVYELKLVGFDNTKDDEVEDDVLSIAEFLALSDGSVGTIQADVTEVVANASGAVSYMMVKDSQGTELKVSGVYNVSTVVYNVGQTLKITGERTGYNGEDGLYLAANEGHSIVSVEKTYLVSDFLALDDGSVGSVKGEITEVSVNASYGTVTSITVKDTNGDELYIYGVWRISDVIYEVGQTVLAVGERTDYEGADQMAFSSDSGHSIEIIGGAETGDYLSVSDFLALADGTVGTVQGEITEVSVNASYGTVTSVTIKDSEANELYIYGVWRISDVIFEVGQTIQATGERTTYEGSDQMAFSTDSGHSIAVVTGTGGSETEDYLTVSEYLALANGTVGTVQGEITEVSVNASYGTVTSVTIKDSEANELYVYGVWRISDVIYEVGQTVKVTGERTDYEGADQMAFSIDSGHSIEIVSGSDSSNGETGGEEETTNYGTQDSPLTVAEAQNIQDGHEAWVEGYIMGNVASGPTLVTDVSSATDYSVAIAASADETDIAKMLIVKLDSGDPRTFLGVASTNGASIGYHVKFNGTLENYYGVAGLKSVSSSDKYIIITE